MGLFKPAWMSKNKEKALDAVKKVAEKNLIYVSLNAVYGEVRAAAMDRMSDEQLLTLSKGQEYVSQTLGLGSRISFDNIVFSKEETIGRIRSPEMLNEVALHHERKPYREYASHRLLDYPEYRETVAVSGADSDVHALLKMHDDQKLMMLIAASRKQDLALTAVSRLTDRKLLRELSCKKGVQETVKLFASGKLGDFSGFTVDAGRRLTGSVSPQVLLDKLNAAGVSCPESVRRDFLDEQRTDEWNKLLLIVKNNALGKDERIKALGRIKDVALPSDCAECVRNLHDSLYSEFGMTEIISALYNAFGYDSVTAAIISDLTALDIGWLGSHLYYEESRSDPRRKASYNAQGILREAYKRKKFLSEISRHFGKPQEHYDYTDLNCNGITEEHHDFINIYFRL